MSDSLKQALDLSLFWEYRGILLQGLVFNALVFLCAAALALSAGLGAALMRVNHFFPTRPAEHFNDWVTHLCCSCILSAARPLSRVPPVATQYNTANLPQLSSASAAPENTLAIWPGRLWRFVDLVSSLFDATNRKIVVT